ncbi:MAG TPA: heterodisulfide reductase-related iron-sulfur binding cluster [Gaiellaceae bacterium]|nr:heterodisulfide reductase-related iron-sulfur binding cluster [Gaiellaceae bacterium]
MLVAAATREVKWEVTTAMAVVLYASMVVALLVFAYGVWRLARVWRLGRPAPVGDQLGARARRTLAAIGQATVLRKPLPGVMHALVFFGWWVLFAATVVVFVHRGLGLHIMQGGFYLVFQSFTVDLFGALVLVGLGIAFFRRYVVRPPELERGKPADALLLGSLALIVLTGFALEGMRIAATDDRWASWSPVGALASRGAGIATDATLTDVYPALWLFHVLLWHALLAAIPYTKFVHVFTSPLNVFFSSPRPPYGVVAPTDFTAEAVRLGINSPSDMTWTQLFMLDACTECGRCEAVCPATAAGKPLSPKRVILDLRDAIRADGADVAPLAGGVITPEALWACTTCRACEEACPVAVEHVPLIVGLRQNLAMVQTSVPTGVEAIVVSLEAREHPFRGALSGRTDWLQGLPVPELSSLEDAVDLDVVYWVGCAAAFDERAQRIARSLSRILLHAGVRFAVLGAQERCTGDPARRTGNEFHYETLARANVETLDGAGVTRIVTHCPHCLQQLRHEYGRFGGRYEVVHHSELVSSLIEQGRVRLAPGARERVAYHDPCYLGRYNRVFDAPRRILDVLPLERVEMRRSGAASFCCGAGGGHAFYSDDEGAKINDLRVREAAETGATTVVTGCPFCLTMLEDGARQVVKEGRTLRARDFAELVADFLVDD